MDHLNLSKNEIAHYPELSSSAFPNLLRLNLSDNQIKQLPATYGLNKLKVLDLNNNKLTSLTTKSLIFKNLN